MSTDLMKNVEQNENDISKIYELLSKQNEQMSIVMKIVTDLKNNNGAISTNSQNDLNSLNTLNVKSISDDVEMINFKPQKEKRSFFSMIATSLNKSSPYKFKKDNNFNIENLGYQAGTAINNIDKLSNEKESFYLNLKLDLQKKSQELMVKMKTSKIFTSTNELVENIILIGSKKTINKLNKQFRNELSLIGFDAQDIFNHETKKNVPIDYVNEKINDNLSKKINLHEKNGIYSFDILSELSPEKRFDMINKIIWPNLKKEIIQTFGLSLAIYNISKHKNRDIKSLLNFCNKNNIDDDTVVHALKNNPDMLSSYRGYEKMISDKNQILNACDTYANLVDNNSFVLKSLINAVSVIREELDALKIDSVDNKNQNIDNLLDDINNCVIGNGINNSHLTIKTLENNMNNIITQESYKKKSSTP